MWRHILFWSTERSRYMQYANSCPLMNLLICGVVVGRNKSALEIKWEMHFPTLRNPFNFSFEVKHLLARETWLIYQCSRALVTASQFCLHSPIGVEQRMKGGSELHVLTEIPQTTINHKQSNKTQAPISATVTPLRRLSSPRYLPLSEISESKVLAFHSFLTSQSLARTPTVNIILSFCPLHQQKSPIFKSRGWSEMDLALSVLAVRYGQIIAGPVEPTDDYRLYCLSQAQSTLIQQSYLHVIYRSPCPAFLPRLSSPLLLYSLTILIFFGSHNPHTQTRVGCFDCSYSNSQRLS